MVGGRCDEPSLRDDSPYHRPRAGKVATRPASPEGRSDGDVTANAENPPVGDFADSVDVLGSVHMHHEGRPALKEPTDGGPAARGRVGSAARQPGARGLVRRSPGKPWRKVDPGDRHTGTLAPARLGVSPRTGRTSRRAQHDPTSGTIMSMLTHLTSPLAIRSTRSISAGREWPADDQPSSVPPAPEQSVGKGCNGEVLPSGAGHARARCFGPCRAGNAWFGGGRSAVYRTRHARRRRLMPFSENRTRAVYQGRSWER